MNRGSLALVIMALLAGACDGSPTAGGVGELRFIRPIGGAINQDWFLTHYFDPPGNGPDDYQCGPKSYLHHAGTDMVLPDFALMDAGVDVYAAAPGVVIDIHDGEFDRSTTRRDGVVSNRVVVYHGNRYATVYRHLKDGSLTVSVGDRVVAGDVLGQVGSSGDSDMPHLHFEVRRGYIDASRTGEAVDPWEGPCGRASSLWQSQLAYQDSFRVIQSGLTTDPMSLSHVKDPPRQVTSAPGRDLGTISAWIQYHNQRPESVTVWRWLRPDGSLAAEIERENGRYYSMSWWWSTGVRLGLDTAGLWSVEIETDGVLSARHYFDVTIAAPDGLAARQVTVAGGGIP